MYLAVCLLMVGISSSSPAPTDYDWGIYRCDFFRGSPQNPSVAFDPSFGVVVSWTAVCFPDCLAAHWQFFLCICRWLPKISQHGLAIHLVSVNVTSYRKAGSDMSLYTGIHCLWFPPFSHPRSDFAIKRWGNACHVDPALCYVQSTRIV